MIISRTPFRVSLLGGGSDFREFYRDSPGAVLTLAINRYMYVTVNKRFDDTLRVSYTRTEIVPHLDDLQHELIREALRMTGITRGVEVTTIADLPAGIGLGSSSTLTVGVLNALYAFRGEFISAAELAERACRIEIDICGKPIGKQDQYIAAAGGFQFVRFFGDERVTVEPMFCRPDTTRTITDGLMLFYTGVQRDSGSVLTEAKARMSTPGDTRGALQQLVALAEELRGRIAANDASGLGEALHRGWLLKKQMGSKVSSGRLDGYYEAALAAGASGGKIAGAGGGGCLLLCVPPEARERVRTTMSGLGLKEISIDLEPSGSTIIHASDWLSSDALAARSLPEPSPRPARAS